MDKLILIEDHKDVETYLRRAFDPLHVRLTVCRTVVEALSNVAKIKPAAVILGNLPESEEGRDLIRKLLQADGQQLIMLITPPENASVARQALREGIHCALVRPLDTGEFKRAVEATLLAARDMRRVVSYEPISEKEEYDEVLVGRSPSMRTFFHQIQEAAQADVPIFLAGAEGTGKSLMARAIHQHSARKNEIFLTVNCESPSANRELFGPEEEFETGAALPASRLEQCRTGTLVLDEIIAIPHEVQGKLLEVLKGGGSGKGGSDPGSTLKARIIVTTRRSIEEVAMSSHWCRELLDYLKPLSLEIPPLRSRSGDIPLLSEYFLKRMAPDSSPAKTFSDHVLHAFESYLWPGNVRELEENVRRMAAGARNDTIQLGDLPPHLVDVLGQAPPMIGSLAAEISPQKRLPEAPRDWASISKTLFQWSRRDAKLKIVPTIERHLIRYALLETNGSQVRAAKLLGMSRSTLRKRIEQLQIKTALIVG